MRLEKYALEKYMRNVQFQRATISLCVVVVASCKPQFPASSHLSIGNLNIRPQDHV